MVEHHNGKDSWKSSIESARGHFDQGLHDLAKAADQAKTQGEEAWISAQSRAREAWEETREKGLQSWEEAQERGEKVLRDAERYVRQAPLKALGVSLGVGFFLGLIFGGRRSS